MSAFGGLILTNQGRNLQAKTQAGAALHFNRISVGDGDLGGSSITDLTALKHEVKSLSITKLSTLSGGKAVVGAVLSNQDLVSGFYWKEIGVFAQDPDLGEILYCYGNSGANAEYIPAGGGADIVEKTIDVVTLVGNSSNVTATIDQSMIFETPDGAQAKADAAQANAEAYADGIKPTKTSQLTNDSGFATTSQLPTKVSQLQNDSGFVTAATAPVKSVNTKTGTITLSASDVGAASQTDFTAHVSDYVRQPGYAVATGAANTYAVTLNPSPTAYSDGMGVAVKINVANTGVCTLNINSLGAKSIVNPDGTALGAGDLSAGGIYSLKYNSTTGNFILVGKGGGPNKVGSNTVITPSTVDQAFPKGYYGGALTDGKVKGDANLIATNIAINKSMFGVAGAHNSIDTISAGTNWVYSATPGSSGGGDVSNTSALTAVYKQFTMQKSGTVRILFGFEAQSYLYTVTGQVFKNGSPVGQLRSVHGTTEVQFTEDFACNVGDVFQIYLQGYYDSAQYYTCHAFLMTVKLGITEAFTPLTTN